LSLPGVYHGDPFAARLLGAFDELVAPFYLTLDSEAALVDPDLTPADLLDWLGGWLGLEFDDRVATDDRRALIADAAALHRRRGTRWALVQLAERLTGGTVTLTETGDTVTSRESSGAFSGKDSVDTAGHESSPPTVHVAVRVDDPRTVDARRLTDLVRAMVPVDCTTTVEVVGS
jgi:phage tail-like protein